MAELYWVYKMQTIFNCYPVANHQAEYIVFAILSYANNEDARCMQGSEKNWTFLRCQMNPQNYCENLTIQ